MDQEPIRKLRLLGLTDYEAKTFVALYKIEEGTASQVARVSKVPRSSVYEVLRSLEKKGAVILEKGKPLRYRLVPLTSALESMEEFRKKEIEEMRENLKDAKRSITESLAAAEVVTHIEEESFWTVRGDDKVMAKIREVIKSAKSNLKVAASSDIFDFLDDLKEAEKNGIQVSVFSAPEVGGDLGLSDVVVASSKELHDSIHPGKGKNPGMKISSGTLVVADDSECVISMVSWDEKKEPLRERTCLWARSEGLARIFSMVFFVLVKGMGKKRTPHDPAGHPRG